MIEKINNDEKRYEELTIEANAKLLSEKIEEFLNSSGKAKYYMSYYVDGKQIYEYLDENLNKVKDASLKREFDDYCKIKRGNIENYVGIYEDDLYEYYLVDSLLRKTIKMVNKRRINIPKKKYLEYILKYVASNKLVELEDIYDIDDDLYNIEDDIKDIVYEKYDVKYDEASKKYYIYDKSNNNSAVKEYTEVYLYENYIVGKKDSAYEIVSAKDMHLLLNIPVKEDISNFKISVYDDEKVIKIDTAKDLFGGLERLFDSNLSTIILYDNERDEAKVKCENVRFFMDMVR